jgi:outer membrane immunogenic protein
MKIVFITICPLIALVAPAQAADLAAQAPPAAPAGPWTGAYVGLNAGWIWSSTTIKNTGTDTDSGGLGFALRQGFIPGSIAVSPNGFIGGGQIGYDWQYAGYWVWGVEADFVGTSAKANVNSVFQGNALTPPFSTFFKTEIDTLGTVRARAGYLWSPILLFYGTGGLAYGQTKLGSAFACPSCSPPSGSESNTTLQASTSSVGWTAGGGTEWKLTPLWSAKLEYLYIDLGGQSNTIVYSYPPASNTSSMTSTVHLRDNIVRLGINYRFF